MGRASCSHYLPLCSPSSGRARQWRSVLTVCDNEGCRLSCFSGQRRLTKVATRPPPFSVGQRLLRFSGDGPIRGRRKWKERCYGRCHAPSAAIGGKGCPPQGG